MRINTAPPVHLRALGPRGPCDQHTIDQLGLGYQQPHLGYSHPREVS